MDIWKTIALLSRTPMCRANQSLCHCYTADELRYAIVIKCHMNLANKLVPLQPQQCILEGFCQRISDWNVCSCSFSVFFKAVDLILVYDDRPRNKEARFILYKHFRDIICTFQFLNGCSRLWAVIAQSSHYTIMFCRICVNVRNYVRNSVGNATKHIHLCRTKHVKVKRKVAKTNFEGKNFDYMEHRPCALSLRRSWQCAKMPRRGTNSFQLKQF